MRRYHHIGIPTDESKPGETHLKDLKLFVVSHQKSEFGVEWMRFEADAAVPDLVRRVAHVAFEVTDLSSELAGREILIPPNSPSDGVRVAFIVENGAPIELLEFTDPKHPARLSNQNGRVTRYSYNAQSRVTESQVGIWEVSSRLPLSSS